METLTLCQVLGEEMKNTINMFLFYLFLFSSCILGFIGGIYLVTDFGEGIKFIGVGVMTFILSMIFTDPKSKWRW